MESSQIYKNFKAPEFESKVYTTAANASKGKKVGVIFSDDGLPLITANNVPSPSLTYFYETMGFEEMVRFLKHDVHANLAMNELKVLR